MAVLVTALSAPARAGAGQGLPEGVEAYSPDRVIENLRAAPVARLSLGRDVPVATFRVTVEQRQLMLTFQEALQKQFGLTDFQRQSQEWRARCCGIDVVGAAESLNRALRRREVRKLREQLARELASIEANRTVQSGKD